MRKTWVLRRLPSGVIDWSAGAEVDLGLVPGLTFKAPEGKLLYRLQAADKATDGVVAALEAVFGREILVNALGAQALVALGLDDVSPRLAVAGATAGLAAAVTGRTECRDICIAAISRPSSRGRNGWFWRRLGAVGAGGRNGWFWRRSGLLEVACDGLAIDLQLDGDSALGPALAMKGQNSVYHGHFEVIRHGAAPGKEGFP